VRRSLLVLAFLLITLLPSWTGSVPTTPEVGPENGCLFADSVLKEIRDEETRIRTGLNRVTLARKVVLVVQIKSGENLRRATNNWKYQHCARL